jgi:hypothetical protein
MVEAPARLLWSALLLVSLTGMAFEPVLGPLFAMTGCLLFLCIPLRLAWMINRHLRARSGDVWRC